MSLELNGFTIEAAISSATRLDELSAARIRNWGERVTALSYLKMGYEVYHQISVGKSVIDFLVKDSESNFCLVEVTSEPE